jgi:hypothetical protein
MSGPEARGANDAFSTLRGQRHVNVTASRSDATPSTTTLRFAFAGGTLYLAGPFNAALHGSAPSGWLARGAALHPQATLAVLLRVG